MSPTVRNVLAVIAGFAVGSVVNMALVTAGSAVVAPPPGADMSSMDGMKSSMHLLEPRHYLFPFLAHALGSLAGAWVVATIAATARQTLALAAGVLFLIGGIVAVALLPAPLWFEAIDLLFAYIPMAWLGARLAPARSAPAVVRRTDSV